MPDVHDHRGHDRLADVADVVNTMKQPTPGFGLVVLLTVIMWVVIIWAIWLAMRMI